jgi:hypothetical protein
MNCKERQSLSNIVFKSAYDLCTSSIIPLEPLEPLPNLPVVELLSRWWNWLDQSRPYLDLKQDDPEYMGYNFTVLESVFTYQAQLRYVYGEERRLCQAVLEARKPWVSK